MKAFAYLYQYQIQGFVNSQLNELVGVAYEWKGEKVYHIFTEYPSIAPSGFPVTCIFRKLNSLIEFQEANQAFPKICDLFFDHTGHKLGICINIYIDERGRIHKSGFVNDDGETIELIFNYVPDKSDLYTRSK